MHMKRRLTRALLAAGVLLAVGAAALLVARLAPPPEPPAVLWSDVPELALYTELFNAAQSRYRVVIEYKTDLPSALRDSRTPPALAVGRFLKSQSVRDRFQSLDYLFGELLVDQSAFYPELLALGNIEGRQLLLPVSFDLPAIIFARGGEASPKDGFVLGADELVAAASFNKKKGASFTRMGFSARWNTDCLVVLAGAFGAAFREGKPLSWSDAGLAAAIERLRAMSATANGSAGAEDDFQFKYLYTPAYKYIAEGRALYAYMRASEFFLVPEEKRYPLDYRWLAERGAVPVSEGVVFAGIPRAGKSKAAAEAFLKWFYREENQKAMLERARTSRALEGSFGVAGGFSAVRAVNERVFPLYYPALVGHLPPADSLSPPNILPSDWPAIKSTVLAPWLLEATAREQNPKQSPSQELGARLAGYAKRERK